MSEIMATLAVGGGMAALAALGTILASIAARNDAQVTLSESQHERDREMLRMHGRRAEMLTTKREEQWKR